MVTITNDHRIADATSIDLGNNNIAISPRYIVLHYTAGAPLSGVVHWLKSSGASYNVLIDVDGSYHQARPFNRPAGHAGRSNWKATSGLQNSSSLNRTSIGISLVNLGGFGWFSNGRWWHSGPGRGASVPDAEANKHSLVYRPGRPIHWSPYTPEQILACHALVAALVDRYDSIQEIVGHDDIAIGGKIDPGPLCPVAEWRREFQKEGGLGLAAEVRSDDGELTLRDLPAASGPGAGTKLDVLRNGETVHIRSVTYVGPTAGLVSATGGRALSGWASVDISGSNTHAGFVNMRYLSANPLAADYAARL